MALIFLGVLIAFTVSSFEFQQVRLPWHHRYRPLMMSGPNSPNLSPLDCQVWSNAGVLTKAATEAKTSSRVVKCTSLVWSAVPEKAIDNATKVYRKW